MKKFIVLFLFQVLLFPFLFSQKLGEIGVSFSIFNSHRDYTTSDIQRIESVSGNGFLSFTVDYFYPLKNNYYIETGINLDKHFFVKYPFANPSNKTYDNENLINIPIGIYKRFWKYGFCNGGLLVDVNYKPGIGTYFGAGLRADSPFGVSLYLNPYIKAHSLLPFSSHRDKYQVIDTGVKIGIIYPLDKLFKKLPRYPKGRGF